MIPAPSSLMRPTPHQEQKLQELLAWWKLPRNHPDYWNCILSAPAGSGKAQPLTELVLTPYGFKPMGEIEVGDYVISEKGVPIRVLETFTTENLNIYKVTFSDNSFTYCCEDHLWLTYPERLRKVKGTAVLSLKQMLPLINKSKTSKESYAYRIPLTAPIEFETNPNLLHCYTLGYALGNGSSSKEGRSSCLILTMAREDFENIRKNIPEQYILSITPAKVNTTVSLIALNEEFRDFYFSFGLRGVTSLDKYIPDCIFTASKQQRASIVRGLCDSDGSCTNNKATFSTSSLTLARDFRQLVLSLGGISTISVSVREDKGNLANTEYTVIFRTPFNPFTLPRKKENYIVREQDLEGKKSIVSAEFIGKQTGRCLVVDSTTHLYITRDYIVTHNTFLTKYFLQYLPGINPFFTATTNEAVNQMEIAGVEEVMTTHRALGLVPDFSKESISFIQKEVPEALSNASLLIVDEASMAGAMEPDSDNMLIVDYVIASRIRTLWIADNYQLPPVESTDGISPIFYRGWRNVALTEVIRNKGEILELCTAIRGVIDAPVRRLPVIPKGIRSISYAEFGVMAKQPEFLEKVFSSKAKVIAWRNSTVDNNNERMRKEFHGREGQLLPKDLILFTSPLFDSAAIPANVEDLKLLKEPIRKVASINAKAEVIQVKKAELFGIDCFFVKLRIEGGIDASAFIPTYTGLTQLAQAKLAIRKKIESNRETWQFWHLIDSCFTKIKHAGAITAHRAQGATLDAVIVNVEDILMAANGNSLLAYKILYTACSRAKHELILIRKRR